MKKHDIEIRALTFTVIGTIVALVGVIIAFLQLKSAYDIFSYQIKLQIELELNEHASDIKSLELELEDGIETMNDLIGKKEILSKVTLHGELILENLKRSVSDGKIMNATLKDAIIETYFAGLEFNNLVSYVYTPELRSSREYLITPFMNFTENKTKPSFEKTLNLVRNYENYLEIKKDIKNC